MSTFSSESFKPENLYSLKGRVAIVTGGATGEFRPCETLPPSVG